MPTLFFILEGGHIFLQPQLPPQNVCRDYEAKHRRDATYCLNHSAYLFRYCNAREVHEPSTREFLRSTSPVSGSLRSFSKGSRKPILWLHSLQSNPRLHFP